MITYIYTDCPKLPEKLSIDGRELFGRMMRGGGVFDERILNAIKKIKGKSVSCPPKSAALVDN